MKLIEKFNYVPMLNQLIPSLNLGTYYKNIEVTAVFDEGEENDTTGLMYTVLGLANEWQEFKDVNFSLEEFITDPKTGVKTLKREALGKELGDVFWYATTLQFKYLSDTDYTYIHMTPLSNIIDHVDVIVEVDSIIGQLAGHAKKYFRDGKDPERLIKMEEQLSKLFNHLVLVALTLDYDPNTVLEQNAEKVLDRRERNVLHGDGDNR